MLDPPDTVFIVGKHDIVQKDILIWAVFGTHTLGLLGSRTSPPPFFKENSGEGGVQSLRSIGGGGSMWRPRPLRACAPVRRAARFCRFNLDGVIGTMMDEILAEVCPAAPLQDPSPPAVPPPRRCARPRPIATTAPGTHRTPHAPEAPMWEGEGGGVRLREARPLGGAFAGGGGGWGGAWGEGS